MKKLCMLLAIAVNIFQLQAKKTEAFQINKVPDARCLSSSEKAADNGNIKRSSLNDPLSVASVIGDKLVRETPFAYRLEIAPESNLFNGMHMVDFGRNFHIDGKAAAFAYTRLNAPEDMEISIQVGHNDACTIWINGEEVYENSHNNALELINEERSIELPFHFNAALKKGINVMLIKMVTNRQEWRLYLQPPSDKGAVILQEKRVPGIGLMGMPCVDTMVTKVSNWLILGPFETENCPDNLLSASATPVFGQMFQGIGELVTWSIPRVDVIGNFFDPRPWGTNYHWNYHNGGVAWAMKVLGEVTGEYKYEKYADDFCDFQLRSIPFLKYETEVLGKSNVPNGLLINTPLLDFTLAPSLPFIYRLRKDKGFENRENYEQFIQNMISYAHKEQVRLPGSGIFTRTTPQKYTTWVDDMFMGIPFLVQAALYSTDENEREIYFEDAVNQILGFNKEVWDAEANLYVHARFSDRNEKMTHWSRANGWGIWATAEVLQYLPVNHPKYKVILRHFQTHVESLIRLQDEQGFWRNVLDHPDSRQEVSGTAIFTMVMARGIREGWLKGEKYRNSVDK